MTPIEANDAGKKHDAMSYTDEEINKQIEILSLVVAYLDGRRDCGLVMVGLHTELDRFQRFKSNREDHPKMFL